ncbi:NOP16 isoform 12 [Pan troglodytes]|uniref:Nucleolar protein 16 n=2 Tax=Pan TaxID=9596 RepID=A0A2J8J610_PANTR|nr:nucleolar protein 16 isoform X1 [Pan troglodytes]XP_055242286.1 nucleolar protein 16 isoform X3 [Gorilla gorilla gorilla]PNI18185.1 NOP16 isoform 12 [Pan troglodytes]
MPKAKGKTRRQKFGYSVNRKRLNRNARRKAAPRIECSHIRHAWDHAKSVRQNLAEMGLAVDPNRAVPLRKRKALPSFRPPHSQNAQLTVKAMEVDIEERPKELVRKPYVLNDLEAEASLPEKKGNTLSRDLIDYVRYMVENHGEDYKAMARDEKNYYQDTPKQIRSKINVYKRFYPAEWQDFLDSLQKRKMEVE